MHAYVLALRRRGGTANKAMRPQGQRASPDVRRRNRLAYWNVNVMLYAVEPPVLLASPP